MATYNTVRWGNSADVVGSCDSTLDAGILVLVVCVQISCCSIPPIPAQLTDTLSGEVCGLIVDTVSAVTGVKQGITYTTLGSLEDDGRLGVAGSLEGWIRSVAVRGGSGFESITSYDRGGRGDLMLISLMSNGCILRLLR